jgi:hypothetical protein
MFYNAGFFYSSTGKKAGDSKRELYRELLFKLQDAGRINAGNLGVLLALFNKMYGSKKQ